MENKYCAGLMSQCFWFLEFKKIVSSVKEGKTTDEIKKLCIDENWFGALNSCRAKRMYGYLINRVKCMNEALIDIFVSADVSTQKLINLICIMKSDRLFFEFVYEVYRDKIILGCDEICTNDATTFFVNKANQSDEISTWKESTIKKLRSLYLTLLTESGLLLVEGSNKTIRKITPPLVDTALEEYLNDNNGTALLKAITGVN